MIATEIGNSRFIEDQRIQLTEIERTKICLKIRLCKKKKKFCCKELAGPLDATFREQANNTVSKSWLRP